MGRHAGDITFLKDFITFLTFLGANDAGLTATGNLNRKALVAIAEAGIPLPESADRYPIRSEQDWVYLEFIDVLSRLMRLTVNRKRCRKLTKSAKEFLALPPIEQLVALFKTYWYLLNWPFLFPYKEHDKDNPAWHLQQSRDFILMVMWEKRRPEGWIDFDEFAQYLRTGMNLKMINYLGEDLPDRVVDCIRAVIIDQFSLLGLIDVEYRNQTLHRFDFKVIDKFRITAVGLTAIRAVSPHAYFASGR